MSDDEAQYPLTLFEGDESIGVFKSKNELFSAVEAPDLGNYRVVDSRGATFKIVIRKKASRGILEAVANFLGAPEALVLIRDQTQ